MAEAIQYPTILPKVAALELTYRCNHKCLFCSCPWEADEKYLKEELSYQEWTRIIDTLMSAVVKAKPAAAKGQYIKSCAVASTMGPGVKVNTAKYM